MSERFFSDTPIAGDEAVLADAEAHHLLHVMRLKVGARVVLFDGSGTEFDAEVIQCGRREVALRVLERREVDREPPTAVTIAVAMPKGDRQRWMVEKLTELGVARLAPIVTERTVAKLSSSALDKLRRAVVEASKQCRRNRLMEIVEPVPWRQLVADSSLPAARYLAHPAIASAEIANTPAIVAVGPEGGFSDAEVAAAQEAGWKGLDLGSRILRTETAAMVSAVRLLA